MTNKMVGRVGDTAVVGAGTYANNATLALSSTGHGELFIAHAVGEQKRSFGAICIQKRTFSQDRLGTNIGKTQKRDRFSSGATISAYIDAGMDFAEAVNKVVHEKLPEGTGGVVAVSLS